MVFKRLVIAGANIFFPPLAVYLLCGVGEDLLVNLCFFLLAVLPSHIHAWYISWIYFNRKRRVRKGRYPGPPKPMIFSRRIQNGGASQREVNDLRREEEYKRTMAESRGTSGVLRGLTNQGSRRDARPRYVEHDDNYYDY